MYIELFWYALEKQLAYSTILIRACKCWTHLTSPAPALVPCPAPAAARSPCRARRAVRARVRARAGGRGAAGARGAGTARRAAASPPRPRCGTPAPSTSAPLLLSWWIETKSL